MKPEEIAQAANRLELCAPDNLHLHEQQLFWALANLYALYRRRTISYEVMQAKRDLAFAAFERAKTQYENWLRSGAVWKMMRASTDPTVRSMAEEMEDI